MKCKCKSKSEVLIGQWKGKIEIIYQYYEFNYIKIKDIELVEYFTDKFGIEENRIGKKPIDDLSRLGIHKFQSKSKYRLTLTKIEDDSK